MGWGQLVDLELDDEDKLDAPAVMSKKPDYPYGLRISLCHPELEKLGLPIPELGAIIDGRFFGVVTSVSANESEHGHDCRVEIQIQKLAVENEDTEMMD